MTPNRALFKLIVFHGPNPGRFLDLCKEIIMVATVSKKNKASKKSPSLSIATMVRNKKSVKKKRNIQLKPSPKTRGGSTPTLLGKRWLLPLMEVDILDLTPDGMNPRYRNQRELYNKGRSFTPKQMTEMLRGEDKTHNLKRSIEMNGGLIEPLTVLSDGTVWEGCRRLIAYGLLYEEDSETWSKIPCYIIPDNMPEAHLLLLRGSWHIHSKDPWDVLARAEDIYTLTKKHGLSAEDIADCWGMSVANVERALDSYKLASETQKESKDGKHFYSMWYEVVVRGKKGVKEILADPTIRKKAIKVMVAKKFKNNHDVRSLAEILKDPKAFDALCKKKGRSAVDAAVNILNQDKPGLAFRVIRRCHNALLNDHSLVSKELKKKKSVASHDLFQKLLDEVVSIAVASGHGDMVTKAKRAAK